MNKPHVPLPLHDRITSAEHKSFQHNLEGPFLKIHPHLLHGYSYQQLVNVLRVYRSDIRYRGMLPTQTRNYRYIPWVERRIKLLKVSRLLKGEPV